MYVQFAEKLITSFAYELATLLFENSCCGFYWKRLFRNGRYRIIN